MVSINHASVRFEIKRTIKRLYGIRSAIVHEGKAFVEEKDVREIILHDFRIIIFNLAFIQDIC